MRTYAIEPRKSWLERIHASGVVLHHKRSNYLWNERRFIELSKDDADAWYVCAEKLYHALVTHTDDAIEHRHLDGFPLSLDEKRMIARSWEMSDYTPTLCTRLDFIVQQNGTLRFSGLASGFTSSLLETAVAQWDWLQETAPWQTQCNTISERLRDSWRQYNLIGRTLHIAFDPHDTQDVNITEYLCDSASSCGVHACAVPLRELSLDVAAESLLDGDGQEIDVLITAHDTALVAGISLREITSRLEVCLVEPHWKHLWQHPLWLEYCRNIIHLELQGCKTIRYPYGLQGDLFCSAWIIAGAVSGLGFATSAATSSSGVTEFMPHMLLNEELDSASG